MTLPKRVCGRTSHPVIDKPKSVPGTGRRPASRSRQAASRTRHRRQRTWAVHGDESARFHGTKRRQAVRRSAAGDGLHMSRRCRRQLRAGSAKRKSCRRIVRKTGRQDRYGRQTMQADTIRRARRYFRSGPVASPSPKRSVRRTDGRLIRQKRPEDRFEAVFGASWLWECYSSAESGSATRMRPQYSQIITFLP